MRLLIVLFALSLEAQTVAVKHRQVMAAAAPTAPAHVSSASAAVAVNGSGNFVLSAITTTVGETVIVAYGAQSPTSCDLTTSVTSAIGGSASGDTFTEVPASTQATSFTCQQMWIAHNVHAGSANYVISVNSTGAAATTTFVVSRFTKGSLTAATDATCTGTSGTTSVSCSGAMTPSTSLSLIVAAAFCWDGGTFTAGAGYAIPSGGQTNGGTGTVALEYRVENPPSGTYTPSFTAPAGGDGVSMSGVIIK